MLRRHKMGSDAAPPAFGNPPVDPTRSAVNMSYPPDQSIYSNPITTNQQTASRSPGGLQVGSLPNMQMSQAQNSMSLPSIINPNSLPNSPTPTNPLPQTTTNTNPNLSH